LEAVGTGSISPAARFPYDLGTCEAACGLRGAIETFALAFFFFLRRPESEAFGLETVEFHRVGYLPREFTQGSQYWLGALSFTSGSFVDQQADRDRLDFLPFPSGSGAMNHSHTGLQFYALPLPRSK